jgi:hypothetical protein
VEASKPVLLLDIDGVINSLLKEPPSMGWPKDAWLKADYTWDGQDWPLLWATPVVEYLRNMHDSGRVEIRWHTTWQDQAPEFAKIVGLPDDWAVADAPEFRANWPLFAKQQLLKAQPAWWKYPAALRVLTEEKRPLIWIDDDLFGKVNRVHRNSLGQLGKILLICPDGQTGILPKHMRQIEEVLLLWEDPRGALSGS